MSIGSNDLTQLTLGLDRDSGMPQLVAKDFDERDPAVKALISKAIAGLPGGGEVRRHLRSRP
jgi:pyruvate,water dikinase